MAKKETTIDAAALKAEFLGVDAPSNKEASAETTSKGIDAAALRAEYLPNSAEESDPEESDADPTLGLKIGGIATRAGLHNLGATMRGAYNMGGALDGVEATDAASQSVANMVGEARKRGYMEAEQKRLKPLYNYLESEGDAGEGIKPIDFTQSTLGKSVEEMMPKSGQYIPRGKALLDIMDKNSGVTDKSAMYNNTDRLRAMYMLNPNMAKDSQHVEWNEHYPAPTTPIMAPSEDGLYHIGENTYTHEDMVNALSGYMPVAQHNRLLKYNEHYRDDYARSLGYKSWDDAWETPLKNLTKELEVINEELASETYDKMVSASAFETAPATEGTAFGTYIADMMRGGLTAQQELEKAKALTADDFIAGFDEGFNTVEVMSLGYAGIGASVNLYNILEKVNNGQALSEREEKVYRAYEIGQELEQLHNEFLGGKKSRGRRWGQGVGASTEAMAQFAASMAATGGIGSGIAAANTGIKQAFKQGLKSGLKQTVKMGSKKAGVYGARSAVAASFSPMTYSTFADRRVGQYHIDESGNLVKETRPWAKDLGIAYVETFNEYFSEYFGNGMSKLIDVSPSKIGRMFGLDKWAGKKGYGNIGDYLDATFVPTKRMREAMHHVDFAGFAWEAPSEAFGDFMNSLMLAPFSEEHGFEQFATKEYWEDLYGTTAIFGGSLSVLGAPATIKNMYNTSTNVKRREAALGKIQDVELRNNLKSVMSLDSMEEMSQAMVDLHIEQLSPDQAAAAVEYLTSATMVKVLTGADMEDTRLLALDGYVKNANNIVYKGKDGSLPSDDIIQVVDKNGRGLYVVAGDVNNTSDVSMLKCKTYDAENRKWVDVAVPASEVMGMKRESVEQVISAEYQRMFGTEIMAERLKEIEGARKSMENPSAEVVRGHYLRNGLKVYTGEEVSLADGRTAVVESMLADGSYLVRSVNPVTQTEELYEVPFMQVLQPEASLAEAQKQMFAKNIESATQSIQRAEVTELSAEAGVAEEEDVDADMEDVVEQAQEMPKPVPTREDGSVDFSAIEDPKMFATEYTKKMGGEDKTKASMAKMAANARAEASQLREKSDKMTDPNEVVDAVAKADAMDARADFYDKVLAEYAPQEEVQSEVYKAGDVVEYDGRIAEVVGVENEGVVIADAQGRMTVVDPTTLSRVAEAPAEENTVEPIEDADDKLIEETEAGIVQNVFGKMLDARTANVIDAMAKALGVKVVFVENVTTQAGTRANADIKGNVVRIAWAQRKKAISFLAGHEFTHRMKDMSPEAYAEFTKSVKEYLGEAEWQRRMNAQRATYESHNKRAKAEGKPLLSYEDTLLEEEVVADFVGDMVENRHAFEHYVQKQSQKPSLLQAIKKVLSAIGRFFRRMGARTEAQRMKEMIAHLDTFINKAREEAKKNGVQGSGKTRNSLPSLVGVHNLSLDKLRKVIKMGGLANPSVAVIDVDKQTHEDYGEYSLILPKNMVDTRQGKNAGTWAGDAWTPTYPQVVKRMNDDKAISRFYKDVDALPEAMRRRVRLDFDSFMEGRSANALAYWYLFEKGNAPALVYIPSRYSEDITKDVEEATNGSFSMFNLTPEERAKCLDAYIAVKFGGDRAAFEAEMQARIERLAETIETKKSDRVKKWAQDTIDSIKEYGFDYDDVAKFIRDVEYDAREKGKVNVDATIMAAQERINESNLAADYDTWRNNLDERYDIEEYIFDGYTNSGNRRYLPHTVENASKWMKKQGRQGAVATFPSFGTFVAVSIPKMTTLESIRKRKALLGKPKEEYDAFREKWENVYYELGKKLQPDAKSFEDYGYWRLIEAVGQKNPKEYIKKEYGVELSEEDMAQLNEMLNAIRTEYPARYFETKFERPLQLSDFTAAVVPNDIPLDVESRLKDAGVEVIEYEKGDNASRAEAMQKASEMENVRFSLQETNDRFNAEAPTFYSNAEFAVLNIKQEKATPEQWLKMIEKAGGLKAGEDKWLGLSDWLKASDKKTLTKDEVLQYIAENDIQIEEVSYADVADISRGEIYESAEFAKLRDDLTEYDEDGNPYINRERYDELRSESYDFVDGFSLDYWGEELEVNSPAAAATYLGLTKADREINSTRLDYTTRGLTNKREIALVVPSIEPYNQNDEIHFGDAGEGRAVAWMRFGETTDADGKRVLVIDEIQSKRHQDGREKGYISDEVLEAQRQYDYLYRKMYKEGLSEEEHNRYHFLGQFIKENYGIVPSAPFEKNWAELAFKRMLRYAAENGYDYVAWTTGDQQAERYDLGKMYDAIEREDNPNVEGKRFVLAGGNYDNLIVNDSGIVTSSSISEAEGKSLVDVVGKDMAEKMMSLEDGDSISGDGLRIGGEGMRGFYDQMLPSFMNKYGKKWGVKVGEVTMPNLEENNTMHSVDVNDAMRESVMQGQPKFSLSEETTQIFDAAKAKFGTTNDMREAGYILPDGSMLDFSGRHQVEGDASFLNGDRTVDHREIADIAYDNDDNETGIKTDLGDFLDRGAIRIDSNAGAINLNVAPTKAQKDRLKRLIERNDGYVYVDFGKGWDTEHYAEYEAARASRVLGDIDRYFDEGIKPTGNVKFSLITPEMDASYLDAVERGDMATAQKMVMEAAKLAMPNTKVVDEDGNPKVVYHGTDVDFWVFNPPYNKYSFKDFGANFFTDDKKNAMRYGAKIKPVFLDLTDPDVFDANGQTYNEFSDNLPPFDGWSEAIIQNIKDAPEGKDRRVKPANTYVVGKNINYQIKSADPVTYDDNGNVIPLSERFNLKKEDIRYSISSEEDARFERKVAFLTDLVREYNIPLPTFIAQTKEEFKRMLLEYGVPEAEINEDKAAGYYSEDDDIIFINGGLMKKPSDISNVLLHENAHNISVKQMREKIAIVAETLSPNNVNAMLTEFFDGGYKDLNEEEIVNEVVSYMVGYLQIDKTIPTFEGQISIEEFIGAWKEEIANSRYSNYVKEVFFAALPLVKENINYQKKQYGAERTNTIVIPRKEYVGSVEGGYAESSLQSDKESRPIEAFSRNAEADRRSEGTDAQEVGYRHSIEEIIDTPSDEEYKQQMLELAQQMERDAEERNLDKTQEIADVTGWVHLDEGTWKYYGDVDITENAKESTRVRRWLESKAAVKKARTRKMYDDLLKEQKKVTKELESESKARRSNASYAKAVDVILQGQAHEALPIEDQILVDVALGQKLRWEDEKGGSRRGLKTELGLRSTTAEGMTEVTGGNTYIEDYVAAVVERNNGYENGIDDNDVRNAVIEVFGFYPSRKAALAELSRRYPDTALSEATEAIAQLEQERDEALAQIDADLSSELADAEANPSKYERAYEEEGTWNLQFDIYTGALRKARNEVSRMERDMQKAKLTQREKTAAMRTVKRAVVDMLKGDLGRYTRKRDIQALMNAVESAQTLYAMQRAIDKAMLAINELRLRKETARMNNLLKMRISSHDSAIDPRIFFENMMKGSKNVDSAVRRLMNDYWRGVNSSGVDVAKGVDGDTARVLQFIRTHSNLTAELGKAPTEGDILKRCEAWRKELRGEAVETSIFSDTERKEIGALTPEVRERMADAVSVIEGYLMVQYQLQNMDEGVTNARQEIAAEKAQIKKLNKEIKALQAQKVSVTDGRIVDANKEIEERKKKVEQINRDIASVRIMNAGVYIGAMPDILDAFSRLNAQVESLLMGGRVDLADFRAKREAHKRELVNMVLEALDNPEALDRNKPEYTAWQKAKDTGAVRFFTNHLGSLDNMLRSIDRNAPNGEGMVHTYFTTKLADAKDAIYENSVKAVDILNSKAQALFGTTFGRAMRKAERKVLGTIPMTRTKEDGTKITEEYEMTVATALYTMMMWNQPASRPALENMGATEEDIEQLRTWLNANNPAWLQFAGWVVNDFLPSNRARYNEVYRAMNGTDMDFAENYFPIRRMSTAIPKEVDLADPSFENKPSTVTGAIMKRTENKLPIDLETSFFGALQDNIVEMEEWSALAPIISDFNAILSSPAVKKTMVDMGKYFHNDFQQAAKVATLKYAGDTKKLDGVFWQMVYRTWASTKLAFKAFTALKQLASSVLFLPYSGDPKFWGRLIHYYLGGKSKLSDAVYEKLGDGSLTNREEGQAWLNIKWALENSSMFRRRWESGVAGNDIFTRELKYDSRTKAGRFMRSISEAVDWLQKKGMAPIALIDAFTVSAGMRAIYEYELANLTQKEGYTKEEAKKIAMRRAEMIANKSQQSSEGEYLAPLQMERGFITSLTMFQNAPFAQGRNIAEAWTEITRNTDKEYAFIKKQEIARMKKARAAEYEAIEATIAMEKELGIITTEEQENLRREKLQRPINAEIEAQAHTATKKKIVRAKMRASRTLLYNAFLGQFVFNLMGKVPYLLFGDDDEEKKKTWIELAWLTAFAPVSTITAGGTLMSILGGHKVSFSGALSEFEDEWNKFISEYKNDGFFEAMLAAGDFLIRKGFGIDYETFMRMYAGIENMFESGMSAENIFMALNAPDSQVRLLAGDRKEGETAQEYATRIMRLYSIFSNPEYSDYYNEKFSYRGENPAFLMSDYMARGMKKSWEMAYRSDVMRNSGLTDEWEAVLDTEEEYEEVVEKLGFKANKTPADEAGYIDGEYRAPIEGLSEDDFDDLKYLAEDAAAVAKDARTYLGEDEKTYLEYVRDEMEAKRELISEYNKILNK